MTIRKTTMDRLREVSATHRPQDAAAGRFTDEVLETFFLLQRNERRGVYSIGATLDTALALA